MKISLTMLLSVGFASVAFVLAEDSSDPFSENYKPEAMPSTPDHLVPLEPYPGDWRRPYVKQLTQYLDLDAVYLARMIVRPSFGAEYSMRVHGDTNSYAFDDSKEYFVSCRISDKSIWYSMPSNNDEKLQKPINPQLLKASLPTATARRVCAIWKAMILRTRYPEDGSGGLDGVTIEFASQHGHGEAWSPTDGTSPALLWDLGEKLIEYCKASDEAKKAALEAINKSANTIEEHLKKPNKP
jgi:hypothetical protein